MADRDIVVFRVIGQRNKAGEPVRFILQGAQLPEVIHPVGQQFDMAVEHGAGAAAPQAMPGAVHVEVFFHGFLAPGDGGADLLAEDFRAAASEGIKARLFQGTQGLRDGLPRQPGQVEHLNRREAL